MSNSWKAVAERKQAQRDALIPSDWRLRALPGPEVTNVTDVPRTCGLLTQHELDITENYDATALAQAIRERKLTCVDVTRAYCKRAAVAQQLTNCLTEIMFDYALARAEALDHHLSRFDEPLGPLHGVPVSLKDSFRVAKYDSAIGIASLAFKPSVSHSPLVSILLSAGAVLYCKTNVPQTLGALDSTNNLWGRTLNPLNLRLTAGGSSGGEGALLAMHASVLGVGTDIGGSIRIPSACNGLYGIKPSANRVPYGNQEQGGLPGLSRMAIEASAGPMARTLRDCELFLKTVAAAKPWLHDPHGIPGTWDSMDCSSRASSGLAKPLTFGILQTDGIVTPLPPISTLLNQVSQALNSAGHKVHVISNPPATLRNAQSLFNSFFEIDGNNTMLDHLAVHDEPLIPWLKNRTKRKARPSVLEVASLQAKRDRLLTDMSALWRTPTGAEIDAVICPIAPHPTPEIDRWNAVGYTSMWVLFDYPAGTVPVHMLDRTDLEKDVPTNLPLGSWDKRNRDLWDKTTVNREVYLGSPLCVQVVAPRLQEKRLYSAMEAVDVACMAHLPKYGGNKSRSGSENGSITDLLGRPKL